MSYINPRSPSDVARSSALFDHQPTLPTGRRSPGSPVCRHRLRQSCIVSWGRVVRTSRLPACRHGNLCRLSRRTPSHHGRIQWIKETTPASGFDHLGRDAMRCAEHRHVRSGYEFRRGWDRPDKRRRTEDAGNSVSTFTPENPHERPSRTRNRPSRHRSTYSTKLGPEGAVEPSPIRDNFTQRWNPLNTYESIIGTIPWKYVSRIYRRRPSVCPSSPMSSRRIKNRPLFLYQEKRRKHRDTVR